MADATPAEDRAFARRVRAAAVVWVALIALMLASLGSAYVTLGGSGNLAAGLGIAAVKAALVAWLFMRLREAGPLIRLVAIVGLAVWGVLVVLSGVDYQTRLTTPSAVQRPQQLLPPTAASGASP